MGRSAGVDDTRSRQLFVSALQMQLKRGQRLHREMPAVSDERWKRWRNQTIRAIERHYPSELERFVLGSEGSRQEQLDRILASIGRQQPWFLPPGKGCPFTGT